MSTIHMQALLNRYRNLTFPDIADRLATKVEAWTKTAHVNGKFVLDRGSRGIVCPEFADMDDAEATAVVMCAMLKMQEKGVYLHHVDFHEDGPRGSGRVWFFRSSYFPAML